MPAADLMEPALGVLRITRGGFEPAKFFLPPLIQQGHVQFTGILRDTTRRCDKDIPLFAFYQKIELFRLCRVIAYCVAALAPRFLDDFNVLFWVMRL